MIIVIHRLLQNLRFSGEKKRKKDEVEVLAPEKKAGLWYPDGSDAKITEATLGDGGASYRASALRRAMAVADETGRDLDDIVKERWGSLADLTQGKTIEETLAARRDPVPFRRKRRPPDEPTTGTTDAAILKTYAAELEAEPKYAIDLKKGHRDDPPLRPAGGDGWTGLSSGFQMGKATFEAGRSWRSRDDERPTGGSRQRRHQQDLTPPKQQQQHPSSNADTAALLRARLGGGGSS